MRRKFLSIGAGLILAASLAGPAAASSLCAGTQALVFVCVDPTGRTYYSDCVYVGPPPCVPVSVPGPTVTCGGDSIFAPRCDI